MNLQCIIFCILKIISWGLGSLRRAQVESPADRPFSGGLCRWGSISQKASGLGVPFLSEHSYLCGSRMKTLEYPSWGCANCRPGAPTHLKTQQEPLNSLSIPFARKVNDPQSLCELLDLPCLSVAWSWLLGSEILPYF